MPSKAQLLQIIGIQSALAKQGFELANVMDCVVESVLSLINSDGAVVELVEGDEMVYRAAAGSASKHLGLRLALNSSFSGLSVRTGEILMCSDSETDDRVDREACRKVGVCSMLVMPLNHEGRNVGVIKAYSATPRHFSQSDTELLGMLSDVISAAMYHASEYHESDLYFRATHDSMTDLANRSVFMDRLRQLTRNSRTPPRPAAIFMVDMDGLKAINDNFGHRTGDAILIEFAHRLQTAARTTDTVARLGGDEFGILLTPLAQDHEIHSILERLQQTIAQPFTFEGESHQLRASIGVAFFPGDGLDINSLMDTADNRMYQIKNISRSLPGGGLHIALNS
ncbi:GGDEF domain-containing protein [Shewanella cyperi]|uniref:GGDEF domain-containing protein n=1 Tax=Shewanella cyperi TaxID=2814292 RepID=A0A975ALD8_9GAMM|nr:sensor domain-containing diguanylate cyclase [Shewanella cyperi]QSX30661.1 GGDEF domain-containing protein [Shewanella cyperi]